MAIDINKILDEARALGCSDLHFTVGIPPIVRQGGNLSWRSHAQSTGANHSSGLADYM